jgi:hypothetical protein
MLYQLKYFPGLGQNLRREVMRNSRFFVFGHTIIMVGKLTVNTGIIIASILVHDSWSEMYW